jgi:DNA mismatch repair ATPase MutS
MNQEIVNAIAAYLEDQTRPCDVTSRIEYGHYDFKHRGASSNDLHPKFCQEIAQEIAAKIEPLLPKENESGNHPDSKYTAHFLEWRSKYFEKKEVTTHFQSNHTGGKFSYEDLELKYAKAMCESPLK